MADEISVDIDGVVYPVRWPMVTARQVGVIRMLHGQTPQTLAAKIDQDLVDLPEVVALAHLSRLQAGDREFDVEEMLDSLTIRSTITIDKLADTGVDPADADPEA